MYSQKDYAYATKKMRLMLAVAFFILLAAALLMGVGLGIRNKPLVMCATIVGALALYTWWTIYCLPWIRYNRHLANIQTGRHRSSELYFMDIADRVRLVDGVRIHDMNASVDPEGEDPRLFYWDDDKPMPQIPVGAKITIESYGNFVLDWHMAEEEHA